MLPKRLGASRDSSYSSVFCFSARWYIKLSGHTYKVSRQAWAVILFWHSVLATLFGFAMMFAASVALGAPLVLLWSGDISSPGDCQRRLLRIPLRTINALDQQPKHQGGIATNMGKITYGRSYRGAATIRKFLTMKLAPPKMTIAPSARGK
jgi:hypothetical protein